MSEHHGHHHDEGRDHDEGHEHIAYRLGTIEEMLAAVKAVVERAENYLKLQKNALTRLQRRVEKMPVNQDVTDALDAVKTSLQGSAAKEHDEFLAAVQAARDESTAKIDELTAKVDELIAKGGTANADELAAIRGLAEQVATSVDEIVPAATPAP